LNRLPLRPELAAPLGLWPSSQLAECAIGRRCWRLCGDVAVLPRCIVCRISSPGGGRPDRSGPGQHPWPVLHGRHCMAVNCNPWRAPSARQTSRADLCLNHGLHGAGHGYRVRVTVHDLPAVGLAEEDGGYPEAARGPSLRRPRACPGCALFRFHRPGLARAVARRRIGFMTSSFGSCSIGQLRLRAGLAQVAAVTAFRRAARARARSTATMAASRAAPRAMRVICQPGIPPVVTTRTVAARSGTTGAVPI